METKNYTQAVKCSICCCTILLKRNTGMHLQSVIMIIKNIPTSESPRELETIKPMTPQRPNVHLGHPGLLLRRSLGMLGMLGTRGGLINTQNT